MTFLDMQSEQFTAKWHFKMILKRNTKLNNNSWKKSK